MHASARKRENLGNPEREPAQGRLGVWACSSSVPFRRNKPRDDLLKKRNEQNEWNRRPKVFRRSNSGHVRGPHSRWSRRRGWMMGNGRIGTGCGSAGKQRTKRHIRQGVLSYKCRSVPLRIWLSVGDGAGGQVGFFFQLGPACPASGGEEKRRRGPEWPSFKGGRTGTSRRLPIMESAHRSIITSTLQCRQHLPAHATPGNAVQRRPWCVF